MGTMDKNQKAQITLRYWLLGLAQADPQYYKCIEAMEWAHEFHSGLRKDGITPEFVHQLTIAHYIRTIKDTLMYPAETLTTVFLHDVPEDYDVGINEIQSRFGELVANATWKLTKVHRGIKKSEEVYFSEMATDPIASIGKGGDRMHNLQSMIGVFTKDKQKNYVTEAETKIIPMLKLARRNFPQQELAYENIKLVLNTQMQLIKATW
jgi:(p)ppGpp synthase/HD superfamily hydrolase